MASWFGWGRGYDRQPPTPKIQAGTLYTIPPQKILAKFELFFKNDGRAPFLVGEEAL